LKQFNNIRHLRELRGYSQKYLASRVGKSQSTLSKIENGCVAISENTAELLSEILEVKKEKIFEDEDQFFQSLDNTQHNLFTRLVENKELLHQVELNQKNILEKLDTYLSKATKKITIQGGCSI